MPSLQIIKQQNSMEYVVIPKFNYLVKLKKDFQYQHRT